MFFIIPAADFLSNPARQIFSRSLMLTTRSFAL